MQIDSYLGAYHIRMVYFLQKVYELFVLFCFVFQNVFADKFVVQFSLQRIHRYSIFYFIIISYGV